MCTLPDTFPRTYKGKVINKCSKFHLIFISYKSLSCCDSPVQDGLLIILRRGSLDLKWWRSIGLAHLLTPGIQAWCLSQTEET